MFNCVQFCYFSSRVITHSAPIEAAADLSDLKNYQPPIFEVQGHVFLLSVAHHFIISWVSVHARGQDVRLQAIASRNEEHVETCRQLAVSRVLPSRTGAPKSSPYTPPMQCDDLFFGSSFVALRIRRACVGDSNWGRIFFLAAANFCSNFGRDRQIVKGTENTQKMLWKRGIVGTVSP